MKVRYIGDYYKITLVKGKVYEVIKEHKEWFRVLDETGEEFLFPREIFEIVKDM